LAEDKCNEIFKRAVIKSRPVRIRLVCDKDREKLIKFYESLSVETIYNRFMGVIRYFDPYVDSLLRKSKSIVIVAEDEENNEIVGVAEAVGDESGAAESGIAVLEKYQRGGLGTLLAKVIVEKSKEIGFKKLYGYIFSHNLGAYRLAKKFGAIIKRDYGDIMRIEISL